jgi:hypothetical protein
MSLKTLDESSRRDSSCTTGARARAAAADACARTVGQTSRPLHGPQPLPLPQGRAATAARTQQGRTMPV